MGAAPRLGTPISLTATGTVKAGSVAGVNADALVSPYGLPMEIHEIKWLIGGDTHVVIGAGLGCSFELGDLRITNGYVPINAFCKSILNISGFAGDFVDVSMGDVNGEEIPLTDSWANFVWRLKHPIFVPAGACLLPKFQHRNLVLDDMTIRVVYSGTTLPSNYRPKKLMLPWVTHWAGNGFTYSAASTQTSLEADLVNPWPEPLCVQRLIGRVNYSGNVSTTPPSERIPSLATATANGLPEIIGKYITITMNHSSGVSVIQHPTKFESVFPASRRAWDIDVEIPPGSYFTVNMTKIADATASGSTAALRYQPIIGMVGYREVGLR